VLPIVIVSVVVLVLVACGVAGVFASGALKRGVKGITAAATGSAGGQSAPSATGSTGSAPAATPADPAASQPAPTTPAEQPAAPAAPAAPGAVHTPQKDTAERKALMDAARAYFGTSSQFYVNQLYVQDNLAVGDIAAVKKGKRTLVVWQGQPWKVIYVGAWSGLTAGVLLQQAPDITPELAGSINFAKKWPADFK
jgi:hypothetical protein